VQFAISDRSRCRKIHTAITHWQPAAQRRRRDFFVCTFCVIAVSGAEMRALSAAAPTRHFSGGPGGKLLSAAGIDRKVLDWTWGACSVRQVGGEAFVCVAVPWVQERVT
jgi:hypothetical protein